MKETNIVTIWNTESGRMEGEEWKVSISKDIDFIHNVH